jgi:hypothetical protein
MEISEAQSKAAGLVVELIADKMGNNRQIHPGTAIASAARLAGSFMFRSFNLQLNEVTPGSAVLSEQANEKGPVLINILAGSLNNLGVKLDKDKMNSTSNAGSNVSFLETLDRLQDPAQIIMSQNNLNPEQMAYSCAMATAFIIKECRNDLACESGFQTAVYGFIEGSKTWPPKLGASQNKKKSLFKFWK